MVKNYFIGNKENFAIEFSIQMERYSRHLFGGIRIWLEGKYFGAYEDINILSVTLHQLEILLTTRKIHSDNFSCMSEKDICDFIKYENNLDGGRHFISLGEAFDDFPTVVYSTKGRLNFIWKLRKNPVFQYVDYPKGILSAGVRENEFGKIIAKFKIQLDEFSEIIPIRHNP